ncbi:hypothetical protein [Romboutsia sp. CE17]|uniref:hypothetical protein n=1 Tax=Romboutsia sp. CE17 TaxID=2724150 RepID=UPI002ED197F5
MYPHELSGGMGQRMALIRTLSIDEELFKSYDVGDMIKLKLIEMLDKKFYTAFSI